MIWIFSLKGILLGETFPCPILPWYFLSPAFWEDVSPSHTDKQFAHHCKQVGEEKFIQEKLEIQINEIISTKKTTLSSEANNPSYAPESITFYSSSVNFVIYCIFGEKFKRIFFKVSQSWYVFLKTRYCALCNWKLERKKVLMFFAAAPLFGPG